MFECVFNFRELIWKQHETTDDKTCSSLASFAMYSNHGVHDELSFNEVKLLFG